MKSVQVIDGSRVWLLRCVLFAMTALVYVPIWDNGFIDYDDEAFITTNSHVKEGLTRSSVDWAWKNKESPYWMPIVWLSFQFDALFPSTSQSDPIAGNLSPTMFHGQNLFWHICNVQLLFALLLRLTRMHWHSFLVAALFAIHPMHVESVAWAIERKDVLMCFFGLLSLTAYVQLVESRHWLIYVMIYVGMLLAYQASLMCKPMLLTLPFVLLLLDYWPLCRLQLGGASTNQNIGTQARQVPLGWLILEKLPMFGVAFIMAAQTMATRPGATMTDLSMIDRVMAALTGYKCYLFKTVYPIGLAVFYPHPGFNWLWVHSLMGAGLIALGTVFSWWQANRWRWLPVGWFWFVGTVLPVIGLAPGGHQGWADRFSYWPHIGLFIVIVWGVMELAKIMRIPSLVTGVAWAVVLGGLMALTWVQVGYWRTSTVLWEHALEVTENNDFAHEHLSICYRRESRIEDADYQLLQASRIQRKKWTQPSH
jgi:hypothetical protein